MTTTPTGTAVGHKVPRSDAKGKVSGDATYAADLQLDGILWAKTVRSPYPHARIVSIDASAALALPGVRAVVTGDDLPANSMWGRRIVDVPLLAQGVARFAGEQVAAVVADDEETAKRGVDLVDVAYEELPAVLDAEAAMEADSALVHPDVQEIKGMFYEMPKAQNHFVVWDWLNGDLEQGFKDADLIIENTYTTPNVHQVYLEPHNQVTTIDDHGVMHVWAPCKAPYSARNQTALALGLEPEQIVFHPVTIGGDFGGKGSPMNIPLGYYLNKAVGQPVRMVFDYTEEFMASNPRHASKLTLRTGVKRDGSIVAHDSRVVFDSGAYAGFKPAGHLMGVSGVAGPYKAAAARITEYMVYTNNPPCGHMRGPGEPQALWALESHIDEIALKLDIDPVAFREPLQRDAARRHRQLGPRQRQADDQRWLADWARGGGGRALTRWRAEQRAGDAAPGREREPGDAAVRPRRGGRDGAAADGGRDHGIAHRTGEGQRHGNGAVRDGLGHRRQPRDEHRRHRHQRGGQARARGAVQAGGGAGQLAGGAAGGAWRPAHPHRHR